MEKYCKKQKAEELRLPKHPYGKLTNDFIFKRIFGTEATKDVLIMFLNQMIGTPRIRDVTIRNSEQLGMTAEDRKAVFDISCMADNNEHFIVEMQNASQEFFRERATFYTSYPTIEQGLEAKRKYNEEHGTSEGLAEGAFHVFIPHQGRQQQRTHARQASVYLSGTASFQQGSRRAGERLRPLGIPVQEHAQTTRAPGTIFGEGV